MAPSLRHPPAFPTAGRKSLSRLQTLVKVMAQTADEAVTRFGETLNSINFWGRSATNPNDMKNNCVSVSVARLEHYPTVEDFWQDIYGYPLPDRPLDQQQILDLLHRTGLTYKLQDFWNSATASAYQQFQAVKLHEDIAVVDECALVCYVRPDGSGHCVNFIIRGRGGWFEDAQTHVAESDLVADIMAATRILVLHTGKFPPPPVSNWQGRSVSLPPSWSEMPANLRETYNKRSARREALVKAGQVPLSNLGHEMERALGEDERRHGRKYREAPDRWTSGNSDDDT